MSEITLPNNIVPIVFASQQLNYVSSVANGVSSLSVQIGTNAMAAFTGLAASEKMYATIKLTQSAEIVIAPVATTTTIALYVNNTLAQSLVGSTTATSFGTQSAGSSITLQISSSTAAASGTSMCTISLRQTPSWSTYFMSNSPSAIPGMVVSYASTGAPIYTFTNSQLIANSAGYVDIDTYYKAIGTNSISFTGTGAFSSYTFSTQSFTPNDNISFSFLSPGGPNSTITLSGTISASIPNLMVASFVYTVVVPYTGPLSKDTPFFYSETDNSKLFFDQLNSIKKLVSRQTSQMLENCLSNPIENATSLPRISENDKELLNQFKKK